jgi:hypothetical protein
MPRTNVKPHPNKLIAGLKLAVAFFIGISIMSVFGREPVFSPDWWVTVAIVVVAYCIIAWLAQLASSWWRTGQKRPLDEDSD